MEDYSVKDEDVQAGESEQGETCGGRQHRASEHPKESPCGCNAESKEENATTLGMRNRR